MNKNKWRLLAGALCLFLESLAQAATITGTVTGPDGPVAGATVVITPDGSVRIESQTNGAGEYGLDVDNGFYQSIIAEPPAGDNSLIGERQFDIGVSSDRTIHLFIGNRVTLSGTVELPPEFQGEAQVEVWALDRFRGIENVDLEQGSFEIDVFAGTYVIHAHPRCEFVDAHDIEGLSSCGYSRYFSYAGVDAREGSVDNILVPAAWPPMKVYPDVPPVASLISVSPPDEGGVATVSGAPGALPGPAAVAVMNSQTAQMRVGASRADGSFDIKIFAPPGSFLTINHDPSGIANQQQGEKLAAATSVQVPADGASDTAFATMAAISEVEENQLWVPNEVFGEQDPGQLWIGGELDDRTWSAGENIDIKGSARIYSRNIPDTDPGNVSAWGSVLLHRVFDTVGRQEHANPQFASHVLTPTGFPIERFNSNDPIWLGNLEFSGFSAHSEHSLSGTWSAELNIPPNLPDGVYQLVFELRAEGIPTDKRHFDKIFTAKPGVLYPTGGTLLIDVGAVEERRLSFALAINEFSNGARGMVAEEDRDRLAIAGRNSHNARQFILPMEDARTGQPIEYRLEPYAPLISASHKAWLAPSTIPFEYPSGELQVRIRRPDGSIRNLGSAPMAQSFMQETSSKSVERMHRASINPAQYFGFTTLDDRFRVRFGDYGLHEVLVTGGIEDTYGNVYTGGGTYEVYVARTLDLETGVFPNTPFEVGDTFSPTLVVQPGLAAEVTIRIQQFPDSDPARMTETIISGKANRFGFFQPAAHVEPVMMAAPGEYRVDYTASYTDDEGILWMGSQSWGNVIATPNSPLIAHGMRNSAEEGGHQQWLFASETSIGGTHLPFPYHNGDIAWMMDREFDPFHTAMVPRPSLQDVEGSFMDMYAERLNALPAYMGMNPDEWFPRGEIPIWSTTPGELSPVLFPDDPQSHWAYAYTGAARPGVRIREKITEHDSDNGYWRFDDAYYYQLGNGFNGDLPNDFKLQYIGIAYRAPDLDFYDYSIHGSLWVLLPHDDADGTRLMPPFQGNGGGPSGGPIMTLKGEEIDIFFHPTGVRPGSILELGQVASFAGSVAPTLPSRVRIRVTSPSGTTTVFSGRANAIGYFHNPEDDFVVDEPGTWKVRITVTHDGATSAGMVSQPFPSGGVLGAGNEGSFSFYVVDGASAPLDTDAPLASFVRPGDGPIDFSVLQVDDLSGAQLEYSVTMPGFLMDQGSNEPLAYSYDSPALHGDFPNLDQWDQDGRTGVDTVTLSFLVSGEDGGGNTVYRARQVLLQGEELLAPPQLPTADTSFTINAGLNDAWFDAGTPGQGFFIIVFPDTGIVFLAWFTYDTECQEDVVAILGSACHRWLTAQGPFDGDTATLDVFSTSGGVFNATEPATQTGEVGTIEIVWKDCESATLTYDIDPPGVQGEIELTRIVPDNVALCEDLQP